MASASEEGLGSHIEECKAFCIMNDCKPLSPANPALAQLTHEEKWPRGHGLKTGTTLPKINLAGTKISPNLYQQ